MTLKSMVLASMFVLSAMAINTAFADTATITASCKDGTMFAGKSKSGACSGHQGVKEWAKTDAPAAKANAPVAAAAPAATKATPITAKTDKADKTSSKTKVDTMPTVAAAGGSVSKVWVNDKSNVYHCFGTQFYGKTKSGSYMTEVEAKAKGGHADHGKVCS